jgi:nucleotide-binding universal stress UspA family protein
LVLRRPGLAWRSIDHLLLCYRPTREGDRALARAAALADPGLTVVLPVVDGPLARGCCAIQPAQWERILDADTRLAARRASALLEAAGQPRQVSVETGPTVDEVLRRVAEESGCDAIAVPARRRPWSSGGFSSRAVRGIAEHTGRPVIPLGE